jgi:hypothetical protein
VQPGRDVLEVAAYGSLRHAEPAGDLASGVPGRGQAEQFLLPRRELGGGVAAGKITGGELATSDEAAGSAGQPKPELPSLTDQAYAIRVLDALHDTAGLAIRPHDDVHLVLAGTLRAQDQALPLHRTLVSCESP